VITDENTDGEDGLEWVSKVSGLLPMLDPLKVTLALSLSDLALIMSAEQPSLSSSDADVKVGLAIELLKTLSGDSTSNIAFSNRTAARWEALKPVVIREAQEAGVNPYFIGGIIWTESSFNSDALNTESGAQGLMQIMPFHNSRFLWLGSKATAWKDPRSNIRAGITILVNDAKLGRDPARAVLARYGGFVSKDPTDYVNKVLQRATFLMIRDLTS